MLGALGAGMRVTAQNNHAGSALSAEAIRSRSVGVGSIHPLQRRLILMGCKPPARAKAIWLPNRTSIAVLRFIRIASPFENFFCPTPIKKAPINCIGAPLTSFCLPKERKPLGEERLGRIFLCKAARLFRGPC